jgi:7,8-dihydroneopterin aldolase/epimerase/oxygenase
MDRIAVPELQLRARVGVGEEERARLQRVVLAVELHLDLSRAGASDDLADTVDYEAVCELAEEIVRSRPFNLIEAMAEAVASSLLERFDASEARVRVRKPGALARWGVPYAEVEVRRRRDG